MFLRERQFKECRQLRCFMGKGNLKNAACSDAGKGKGKANKRMPPAPMLYGGGYSEGRLFDQARPERKQNMVPPIPAISHTMISLSHPTRAAKIPYKPAANADAK